MKQENEIRDQLEFLTQKLCLARKRVIAKQSKNKPSIVMNINDIGLYQKEIDTLHWVLNNNNS